MFVPWGPKKRQNSGKLGTEESEKLAWPCLAGNAGSSFNYDSEMEFHCRISSIVNLDSETELPSGSSPTN